MSTRVLVFSADELRGKIINKVLDRNGLECLFFNRIKETVSQKEKKGKLTGGDMLEKTLKHLLHLN